MVITTDLVEAFLKCPTKCFLRSRAEVANGNAYADWVRTKGEIFRTEGITRLTAGAPLDRRATGTAVTESGGSPQWELALDFTARSENLQCSCHAVQRLPSAGQGRAAQFVPIRFVFSDKITRHDKLLLAFDGLVISEVFAGEVTLGKIVHGDDHVTLRVKVPALKNEVAKVTDRIDVLITSASPPDLVLNRHCAECEFQTRCRQKAVERDDLSLLSSMTERERTDFNSKGIFTVTQLSFTFRPRRRPKGLRDKRERHHHALKALAIRENKLHIVGSPEFKIDGTPVYLDVEGLTDRGFYYLVGIRTKAGDSVVQHSLWADEPSDEAEFGGTFLSKLTDIENPILIHYGSFETVFLKRMCERYGGPPNGSGAAKALESPVNLLSVIFGQIYFPTYSNGLKEIAGWLGFRWSDRDSSGVQSIVWRNEWEQAKAPSIKDQLITYNSEDCAALELVADAVRQVCQNGIGSDSERASRLEVVDADKADSKTTMWGKFSSSIHGFEAINKAARWNYQRDRIYIRTDVQLKKAKRKKKNLLKRAVHISKVVVCQLPPICPLCQKKGFRTSRMITKRLHDLRFSRSGVTGWIRKYQFQVFQCPACRSYTPWPKEFWDRTMYGRNLVAFCIFEIIELCVLRVHLTDSGVFPCLDFQRFASARVANNVARLVLAGPLAICSRHLVARLKNPELVLVFAYVSTILHFAMDQQIQLPSGFIVGRDNQRSLRVS